MPCIIIGVKTEIKLLILVMNIKISRYEQCKYKEKYDREPVNFYMDIRSQNV